mmetsp:Transcript_1429/g.3254  ORF Transcript_1429/g.3254 Transcript_1429/m.3254 type:complete len:294 (-) Transcript_1429:26-907(-)
MFSVEVWIGLSFLVAITGLLIGSIGVGGVILVPVMLEMGINVKVAVTSSMASYIAAGIVGTLSYLRENSIDSRVLFFCVGATPGAFLGSFAVHRLQDQEIEIAAYVLILASTSFTLLRQVLDCQKREYEGREIPPSSSSGIMLDTKRKPGSGADITKSESKHSEPRFSPLITSSKRTLIGIVVGFGSALTGTSGPVLILPLLFLMEDFATLAALGIAQTVQIPIATAATVGNIIFARNQILLPLVLLLAGGLCIFVPIGTKIAHSLPRKTLKAIVDVALLGASIYLIVKVSIS